MEIMTGMAVEAFRAVLSAEHSLEKKRQHLNTALSRIADSELDEYFQATEDLREKYETR